MSMPAPTDPRFAPHAQRALGEMFSDVSPRYDLLNALLSLGQDRVWRYHLWAAIPESARVVADVCCGSGASLWGLRRPGRTVLGLDASALMLEAAAERSDRRIGAPRLVRADAFHLPLADASVEAITMAFGLRNLRPRPDALRELARVLRPGGTLAVLETAAPRKGPLAPFHRAYLRWVVPALGHLSPSPSAYAYLARSILEFGDGTDLAAGMSAAGLRPETERRFLLGATWLWTARREAHPIERRAAEPGRMQFQRARGRAPGLFPRGKTPRQREWQLSRWVSLILQVALIVALSFALITYRNFLSWNHFRSWFTAAGWLVLWGGMALTVARLLLIVSLVHYPPEDP